MPTQYKAFTDPIHGFIHVPKGITLRLLDHPYVQRLRRIRQLGMAYNVFPGAEHSRFSHALGALGLMIRILNNLREKNTTISNDEYESMLSAILLHDIGHGPFSHTLENTLIKDFHHEMMTLALMNDLNKQMDGALTTTIKIFTNQHSKPFLHQLISSQLDVDRMDYLKRDSFYTGVLEGSIGVDRIIKTLRVHNDNIVIEKKGIYAIENYIMARRLMYMQVYLHKTVLCADMLIGSIFDRARDLVSQGETLFFPSPALQYFIEKQPSARKKISSEMLHYYTLLDDNDVLLSIKYWVQSKDPILSDLCSRLINRRFLRTTFFNTPIIDPKEKESYTKKTAAVLKKMRMPFDEKSISYYLKFLKTESEAYRFRQDSIWILDSDNTAVEFSKAADANHILALSKPVVKYYAVHLKEID